MNTTSTTTEVISRAYGLFKTYMERVNNIDVDYFENITCDSEQLPAELDMRLRNKIMAKMKQYAMQLLGESDISATVHSFAESIADAEERRKALVEFKDEVRKHAYNEANTNGSSQYTLQDLNRLYEDAKTRTMWERVTSSNKADVIKFHHALLEKTYEDCKDIFWGALQDFALELSRQYSGK